jgi:hypothetical protein
MEDSECRTYSVREAAQVLSRGSKQVSGRAEPPLLSVNGLVDRRGVEPLTSAVQRRRSPN